MARRATQRAIPVDRRLLRNAPPYPRDRYQPADRDAVEVPDYLPDADDGSSGPRGVLRLDHGRRRRRRPIAGHARRDRAWTNTWVVFFTDHGPALPRAKSTLYDAGTGIAMIVRPPRGPADRRASTTNCSAESTCCRPCSNCSALEVPGDVDGISHARACSPLRNGTPVRAEVYTRRRITIPSIRSARSGRRNTATSRTTRRGRCSTCRGISRKAHPVSRSRSPWPAPARSANSTTCRDPTESRNLLAPDATDKAEAIANELALLLNDWRLKTNDVIPSDFAGTRISERYTETYQRIHGRALTSRSAIAAERGVEDDFIA